MESGGQIEGHILPSSVVARAPVSNENVGARSEKEGWQGKVSRGGEYTCSCGIGVRKTRTFGRVCAAGETGMIPMNRGRRERDTQVHVATQTSPVILEIGSWNVSSRWSVRKRQMDRKKWVKPGFGKGGEKFYLSAPFSSLAFGSFVRFLFFS